MHRGTLLGLIGGLAVFIIIFSFIIYNHSDFDQQLMDQVDNGVPAEKLIPQIDEETEKLKLKAKRRLETYVLDRKYWGNGELASIRDYQHYTQNYEGEMKVILDYDTIRKKYVKREISKEEFLKEIKGPKDYFNMY